MSTTARLVSLLPEVRPRASLLSEHLTRPQRRRRRLQRTAILKSAEQTRDLCRAVSFLHACSNGVPLTTATPLQPRHGTGPALSVPGVDFQASIPSRRTLRVPCVAERLPLSSLPQQATTATESAPRDHNIGTTGGENNVRTSNKNEHADSLTLTKQQFSSALQQMGEQIEDRLWSQMDEKIASYHSRIRELEREVHDLQLEKEEFERRAQVPPQPPVGTTQQPPARLPTRSTLPSAQHQRQHPQQLQQPAQPLVQPIAPHAQVPPQPPVDATQHPPVRLPTTLPPSPQCVDITLGQLSPMNSSRTGSCAQTRTSDSTAATITDTELAGRTYLNIPYYENELAKSLGVRYDRERNQWYVGPNFDMSSCRWKQCDPKPKITLPVPLR